MKEDLSLVGGFGAAGLGPFVAVTTLSPMRGKPLATGIVVLLLIVSIAVAAVLAGPKIGAVATVNAGLWFNFLFVDPTGILKPADVLDWPTGVVLVTGSAIVLITQRSTSSARRGVRSPATAIDPVPAPSRHIERIARLIDEGADQRDLIAAVQIEITSLLGTRQCRFEAGPTDAGVTAAMPRLERGGTIAAGAGALERVEVPVQVGSRRLGRLVLDLTPGMSIPFEHRLIALILADHLAAALGSHHKSTTPTRHEP